MHSVLLNQLGTFAVLFSIPKLLDKRTRPTVSTVATDVCLWCSRIRQLYVSTGVQLKHYIFIAITCAGVLFSHVIHDWLVLH